MGNSITFKIKTECYLEFLSPQTMRLLGSTKTRATKGKNEEKVPHLENTKVILVCCNLVSNDYQQDSRVLYTFVSFRYFDQLLYISLKI